MQQDTKPLKFAALIRVSTEKQEKEGESLRTQRTEIGSAVEQLGGQNVKWFGGQEHATPGWEKTELDRLLADAQKQPKLFNAVIVSHADRWSRDNAKSHEGLEVFRKHSVRFFVGVTEYDLFSPEHCLFLGMSAEFGQFQARQQNLKSLKSRIHRAKTGVPTCGRLPYGRTKDSVTGSLVIDEDKQRIIQDAAKRYLAGERLPDLAREYKMNHANLHKILSKRCGTEWVQTFDSNKLNIHEVVMTEIPRLLPEETIKAIHERAEANRTYRRGPRGNRYLLSHVIFCAHCGYALFGQTNRNGNQFYRHCHTERTRPCNGPEFKSWVKAEEIEDAVIRELFGCFGNPQAVKRAIEAATPNLAKIKEDQERVTKLRKMLERVKSNRARTLGLRDKELISEEVETNRLKELKAEEDRYLEEWNRLNNNLQN
ncbi:MAG: recombinase family protein, partial [Terracidiphilus sp.]